MSENWKTKGELWEIKVLWSELSKEIRDLPMGRKGVQVCIVKISMENLNNWKFILLYWAGHIKNR